ncbi:MAG: immunity protein 39 [Candidatus Paracaedibacteraceae bacterium]|nr:immunity protein 39 [Candidatus Paracaedibacteraceae bacterium]
MHSRKFVPGVIFCKKGHLINLQKIIIIQDLIENVIIKSTLLENAPFKWINLMYRLTEKNKLKPSFMKINQQYGDLPIAIELDLGLLKWADSTDPQLLIDIFIMAGLEALLHVCEKYQLPKEMVVSERHKYPDIQFYIDKSQES